LRANCKSPQEGPKASRSSRRYLRSVRALGRDDRLLLEKEEPPLGAHLLTPRRGFAHHGIYVGHGNVVHYKSAVRRFCRGPVEEVALEHFALGRAIWVQTHATPRFEAAEAARRARSRIGEDRYRLFTNNCEHLCEWCLQDEERSYQIERLLRLPRWLARMCRGTVTTPLRATAGRLITSLSQISRLRFSAIPP
jgi:hypothetical protein